jgi:hypothetical protein
LLQGLVELEFAVEDGFDDERTAFAGFHACVAADLGYECDEGRAGGGVSDIASNRELDKRAEWFCALSPIRVVARQINLDGKMKFHDHDPRKCTNMTGEFRRSLKASSKRPPS